jgi:hypothetical protein
MRNVRRLARSCAISVFISAVNSGGRIVEKLAETLARMLESDEKLDDPTPQDRPDQ